MDLHIVYITTKDAKEAKHIAHSLVADDLAVCVNILGSSKSFYKWQGTLNEEDEQVLIAKVRGSRLHEMIAATEKMHSYDCPCIVSLPIEGGSKPYLDWLSG